MLARAVAKYDGCKGKCDALRDQDKGIFYVVKVHRHLRGKRIDDGVFFMRTGVNSALCGGRLSIGRLYLFELGKVDISTTECPKERYLLSGCLLPKVWWKLGRKKRRFANRGWRSCV